MFVFWGTTWLLAKHRVLQKHLKLYADEVINLMATDIYLLTQYALSEPHIPNRGSPWRKIPEEQTTLLESNYLKLIS
jgi:hypothetical protein